MKKQTQFQNYKPKNWYTYIVNKKPRFFASYRLWTVHCKQKISKKNPPPHYPLPSQYWKYWKIIASLVVFTSRPFWKYWFEKSTDISALYKTKCWLFEKFKINHSICHNFWKKHRPNRSQLTTVSPAKSFTKSLPKRYHFSNKEESLYITWSKTVSSKKLFVYFRFSQYLWSLKVSNIKYSNLLLTLWSHFCFLISFCY